MSTSNEITMILDEKTKETILAVADTNRLEILFHIGNQGRMCVGDIASRFKISRPAISHHLKVLKNCGLVSGDKVGQEIYYSVNVSDLIKMLRDLADNLENCCCPK
ncbi:MAG: metalloregulator ArsR/SmtB family transcription factor [Clostridia bacterium]|nr:metalloregulator ArsR/SmtB family transcription factor [Clostridia bacterium]